MLRINPWYFKSINVRSEVIKICFHEICWLTKQSPLKKHDNKKLKKHDNDKFALIVNQTNKLTEIKTQLYNGATLLSIINDITAYSMKTQT